MLHAAQRPAEPSDINFNELDLKYEVKLPESFVIQRHCWSPKPSSSPNLPFDIERTTIGLSLPVYTEFKAGRTKVQTILRKCKGDIDILKSEVEKVVGKPVLLRPGKIVIDGNYHRRLKIWLTGLGF